MVGLVLVSHSRALAQSIVDLIRQTVSAELPVAPAGGVGDGHQEIGTDALDILEAINSVLSPDGVLVLMDMGSAILSAETAKEFVAPDQQNRVLLCSAPLVEGGIAAAIQIQIGSNLDQAALAAKQGLLPKRDQLGDLAAEPGPISSSAPEGEVETVELTMANEHGLHLRPAANLLKALSTLSATVQAENITTNRGPAQASSLVELARLQIRKGDRVRFRIAGNDRQKAVAAIEILAGNHFGESEISAPPLSPIESKGGKPFAVSSGIAIGSPIFLEERLPVIPHETVVSEIEVEAEIAKLRQAVTKVREELQRRTERMRDRIDATALGMLEAQQLLLQDVAVIQAVEERIRTDRESAALAWHSVLTKLASEQQTAEDSYFRARAADFREIDRAVLVQILPAQSGPVKVTAEPSSEPAVLVCRELTPSVVDLSQDTPVAGVVQLEGGSTSHGAILARALRLPAVGGASALEAQLRNAKIVALDGDSGEIWIEPDASTEARLRNQADAAKQKYARALHESVKQSVTRDGERIKVSANASTRAEVARAVEVGAESIGLFRSEFLLQTFSETPTEDQQYEAFRHALEPASSIPVTIRLLDIGGDKPLPFLSPAHEANPFLGVRGVRLLLQQDKFLRSHLRAILRVGERRAVRIMIPMVTELEEVIVVRRILEEMHFELEKERIAHRWPSPLGIMVETPAAALMVDQFLPHIDFVSFGTNDLTQYVLCSERGNPSLQKFADALNPAVLRLCKQVVETLGSSGTDLSICGEIAADPDAIPVLLALGIHHLSVAPASIPGVKGHTRHLDLAEARNLVLQAWRTWPDAAAVRAFSKQLHSDDQP
jgi:phosphocarrier protein FPr